MSTADPKPPSIPGLPDMPEVVQHLVKPDAPITARVHATRICTASHKASGFVRHIELDVSGTALQNGWVAGQSFGVIPAGFTENGHQHKLRLYSIAAPTRGEAGDGTILSTTTKRLIDEDWDSHQLFTGVCSNYLCDLKVGDPVLLTGPAGKRFVLPKDPTKHDYLFIATGTGIAPFRAMLADLIELAMPSKATLIMGAPYETDLLYHETMNAWTHEHANFRYLTAISRHTSEEQPREMYVQDRLSADDNRLMDMLDSKRTLIYICGVAGMELGIFQALARLLTDEQLSQYLKIKPELRSGVDAWERRMIPRGIKPSKRVFLEVY